MGFSRPGSSSASSASGNGRRVQDGVPSRTNSTGTASGGRSFGSWRSAKRRSVPTMRSKVFIISARTSLGFLRRHEHPARRRAEAFAEGLGPRGHRGEAAPGRVSNRFDPHLIEGLGGPRGLRIWLAGFASSGRRGLTPGPFPAAAAACLLDEAVLRQGPQVEGAVGRGLAEHLAGLVAVSVPAWPSASSSAMRSGRASARMAFGSIRLSRRDRLADRWPFLRVPVRPEPVLGTHVSKHYSRKSSSDKAVERFRESRRRPPGQVWRQDAARRTSTRTMKAAARSVRPATSRCRGAARPAPSRCTAGVVSASAAVALASPSASRTDAAAARRPARPPSARSIRPRSASLIKIGQRSRLQAGIPGDRVAMRARPTARAERRQHDTKLRRTRTSGHTFI